MNSRAVKVRLIVIDVVICALSSRIMSIYFFQSLKIFICLVICIIFILTVDYLLSQSFDLTEKKVKWNGQHGFKMEDIQFNLNSDICNSENDDIFAVFVITSFIGNEKSRNAIRQAVSREILNRFHVKLVFNVALEPLKTNYGTIQKALYDEFNRFGDIIQGDFYEAYRNLTYKHLLGLKWAAKYCPRVKYVIKMDDDIVFDFHRIVERLHQFHHENDRFMAGYILRGMLPKRDVTNKWFVTKQEYSKSRYPPFLSGWFYVTTPEIAGALYEAALRDGKYFWIDDVYVTGILMMQVKKMEHYRDLALVDLRNWFTTYPEFLQCCINDIKLQERCEFLIGPNGGDENLVVKFNENMSQCYDKSNFCKEIVHPSNKTWCVVERKRAETSPNNGRPIIDDFRLF